MSKQELNKKQTTLDLKAISLTNLIPLHIPQKIQDKIEYLCQRINEVEWSGVLFYSVKGTIKDFDTVELTIEDIFPMDKGTSVYTGYELGDEIIDYRMNNPQSLSWKMGMIHSHHSMKSYFSGTDLSELSDNTEFHNYYLSLIVNNFGEMVAKVAFRGEVKGYECKDEQGKSWNLNLTANRQEMFAFDCDIHKPKTYTKVPKEFSERISEVIKECDGKRALVAKEHKKFNTPTYGKKNNIQQKSLIPHFPAKLGEHKWFQNEEKLIEEEIEEDWNNSFNNPNNLPKNKKDMSEDERYWDFSLFLIRLGVPLDGHDTLENALEDTSVIVENVDHYVSRMAIMYPALFEQYWDIFGEINTEIFLVTTSEVVSILENYMGLFEIVEPLVESLELMIVKMQGVDG